MNKRLEDWLWRQHPAFITAVFILIGFGALSLVILGAAFMGPFGLVIFPIVVGVIAVVNMIYVEVKEHKKERRIIRKHD